MLVKNLHHKNKLSPPWIPDPHVIVTAHRHGAVVRNTKTDKSYHRSYAHLRSFHRAGEDHQSRGAIQFSKGKEEGLDPLVENLEPSDYVTTPNSTTLYQDASQKIPTTLRLRRNSQGLWTRTHVMFPS